MDRTRAYRELRRLLEEAAPVLGERWLSLGIGCAPSSIKTWLMRQNAHLQERTMGQILPRLYGWQAWVPAYKAARAEGRRLADEPCQWENRVDEFRRRLQEALEVHPLQKVATGCEVSDKQLLLWYTGRVPENQRDEMLKALGFLRHLDNWPAIGEEAQVAIGTA